VIGGLAIDFCYSPEDLVRQLAAATVVDPDRPVRIDRYLEGIEVDVDAVSDEATVLIPGLLDGMPVVNRRTRNWLERGRVGCFAARARYGT